MTSTTPASSCFFNVNRLIEFLMATAIFGLLWPQLIDSEISAFRDGFHFYYPQAVWLNDCYARGEYLPSWNPNEGLGSSVSGQPTSQIYYPGRILFLIPGLNVAQRNAIFIAVHLWLAAVGMVRACKLLNLTPSACWFAAVAYTLGCPVLFQVHNQVYLCSATWLAWGISVVLRLSIQPWLLPLQPAHIRWIRYLHLAGEFSIWSCLMTLAGDPHGAVNYGLIVLLALLFHWRLVSKSVSPGMIHSDCGQDVSGDNSLEQRPAIAVELTLTRSCRSIWYRCFQSVALPIVALLLIGLVALQVRHTLSWLAKSNRTEVPFSTIDSFHPRVNEILSDPSWQPHLRYFDFSLSPWNLPTLLWPTWSGNLQPENSRWVQAIPSESRMWIPSLYMGTVPFAFALAVLLGKCCREQADTRRLLICILVISALASLGNYSLIWLLRNLCDWIGTERLSNRLPSDSSLSLYGWLLKLPGYSGFRYPAKWTVWIAASLALLAGMGCNSQINVTDTNRALARRLYRWLIGLSSLSVLMSVGLLVFVGIDSCRMAMQSWLASRPDSMLGSPSLSASVQSLLRGWLQPVAVIVGFIWLVKFRGRFNASTTNHQFPLASPIEAANSNRSVQIGWLLVGLTLIDLVTLSPQWLTTTAPSPHIQTQQLGRSDDLVWVNTSHLRFQSKAAAPTSYLGQTLELQSQFLLGKLNLLTGKAAFHSSVTIEPAAIMRLRSWLQRADEMTSVQPQLDQVLGDLGVTKRLVHEPDGNLRWKSIPNARPLCEFMPLQSTGTDGSATLRWEWVSSSQLQIELELSRAGTLLVRQLNDGSWLINGRTLEEASARTSELFVSIPVTPGKYHVLLHR